MLQGSLDDFALDEVLGLLASTSKSGRLRLSGNRGTGSLWLDKGHLTAAEASKIPGKAGVEDVVFEMLRFADGTFSFMIDDVPTEIGSPEQVDFVVQLAQDRLAEWRTIESVVPSLAHTINLADELPGEELEISRSEWKTVIAVGGNATVEPVCEQLGLDEVDGSRRIMQMIQRGLLTISDPADTANSVSTVVVAEAVIPEPYMVAEADSSVAPSAEPVEAPATVVAETVVAKTVAAETVLAEPVVAQPVVAETVVAEFAPVAEFASVAETASVAKETIVEATPEAFVAETVVAETVVVETVVVETVPAAEEAVAPIEAVIADTVIAEIAPGALPERPSGAESVLATSTSTDFMAAVPAAEVAPVTAAPVAEVEQAQTPASDPFAPPPGPSPFGLNALIEAPVSTPETESSEGRPPMPPPPSPSEIDSFSANLEEESPFESGELLDESLTGAKEEGGSILMRYLRNDR